MTDGDTIGYSDVLKYPYWRHRIDLRDGRVTPGVTPTSDWNRMGLPEDMSGRSFLDVGCFDGLHAFEAERRGSPDVLGTDIWEPDGSDVWWYGRLPRRDGFELVRKYLSSDVRGRRLDVHDLSPDDVGTFDTVLFSKVLPFVPDPYSVLENLVSVTDNVLIVESATPPSDLDGLPAMELAGVTTENENRWWHPTARALEEMLLEAGCSRITVNRIANHVDADDLWNGVTNGEVPVFSTMCLNRRVDDLSSGQHVTVLYEGENAVRVQYRHHPSEPYRQGWVSVDSVGGAETTDDVRRFANRAVEYYRDYGLGALVSEGFDTVRSQFTGNDNHNLLACGYVD